MLKVYLAGASRELDRIRPFVSVLDRSGIVQLTYRWWEAVEKHGVGRDHELTRDQAAGHALNDLDGVRSCQLFWVLWPENHSVGAPLEFGFAMASGIPTIVTGKNVKACIFTALATYRDDSDALGMHEVMRRAGYFGEVA